MSDLKQYENKKVIVTRNLADGTADELEGTVTTASAAGLIVKPKGKTSVVIVGTDEIVEVRYVVDAPKAIKAKELKPITFGQARGHLLDRHGYALADINKMDEAAALEFHDSIDHAPLGHVHVAASETPVAQAVAAEESAA